MVNLSDYFLLVLSDEVKPVPTLVSLTGNVAAIMVAPFYLPEWFGAEHFASSYGVDCPTSFVVHKCDIYWGSDGKTSVIVVSESMDDFTTKLVKLYTAIGAEKQL